MALTRTFLSFKHTDFYNSSNKDIHIYSKNKLGVYLDSNELWAKNAGLTNSKEICGLTDNDLKPLSTHEAMALRENDLRIMLSGESQVLLEPVTLHGGKEVVAISHKSPLKSSFNNKILGITGISIIVDKNQFIADAQQLLNTNVITHSITDSYKGKEVLTPREINCLRYYVKGKTAKQIAHTLMLSVRTVEQYLAICKQKLNCVNRSELIEEALKLQEIRQVL